MITKQNKQTKTQRPKSTLYMFLQIICGYNKYSLVLKGYQTVSKYKNRTITFSLLRIILIILNSDYLYHLHQL